MTEITNNLKQALSSFHDEVERINSDFQSIIVESKPAPTGTPSKKTTWLRGRLSKAVDSLKQNAGYAQTDIDHIHRKLKALSFPVTEEYKVEAIELRLALRSLPKADQAKALADIIESRSEFYVRAVAGAPWFLTGLGQKEHDEFKVSAPQKAFPEEFRDIAETTRLLESIDGVASNASAAFEDMAQKGRELRHQWEWKDAEEIPEMTEEFGRNNPAFQ